MDHALDRRCFLASTASLSAWLACRGGWAAESKTPPTKPFTLWQLPPQTHSQMNSYVIRTGEGRVLVIDGGTEGDAPYLRGFLGALGNHVDSWFISHPHFDHVDAARVILHDPAGIRIDAFYASLPEESWIEKHRARDLPCAKAFNEALRKSGVPLVDLTLGQILEFDGIRIEILGVRNPEITGGGLNNQSVAMLLSGRGKTVLFLGDLARIAGRKLMKTPYAERVRADYVQMAHHGQGGVDEDFYKAVAPQYCLWPTPRWLWDVDNGGGKGSGPWKTLETRVWMDKLNVKKHYVTADGLHRIDF